MERLQAQSNRLADETAARVVAAFERLEAGEITRAEYRSAAVAIIARANAAGVALADVGLNAEVLRQTGRVEPPVGIQPNAIQLDEARIAAALDEATDSGLLSQLARSEPLLTVATTVQAGMKAKGAQGWTRGLSGSSCPLCSGWADGKVRSVDTSMVRHRGCDCIQQPTFT